MEQISKKLMNWASILEENTRQQAVTTATMPFIHPHQALRKYRERTGINARLAVVAMTPTEFSIADPSDPGSLDVAGFDSAVPTLLADFSRGDV